MLAKTLVGVALLALLSVGCSSNAPLSSSALSSGAQGMVPAARAGTGHPVSQYISHVIVIIQENRSFENLFAGFPGANAPMSGCVAPTPSPSPSPTPVGLTKALRPLVLRHSSGSGCAPGDTTAPLHQVTFNGPDIRHDWTSSIADWDNGNMDGFWQYGVKHGQYQAYAYVQQSLLQPYWTMAQTYVLADAMYPTEFGGSFTGHLTLVAGTDNIHQSPSRAEVDFPSALDDGCDSAPGTKTSFVNARRVLLRFQGPFPCFSQFSTIAQVLDSASVSWKYYTPKLLDAGLWEPFEAISYVRNGPDWNTNIVAPQTQILTDPGNSQLPAVSFVTPSKTDSDHPTAHSDKGPSWVASVVNAIGESSYWNTSAIIVVWDDWGGWYDNASPPQLDYRGLGIRIPCLIISPYARQTSPSQPGYVSHTQYEFGSILRFIEEANNLPSIGPVSQGYTDQRANPLDDSFDFTQQPRPFVPIGTKYSRSRFLHERPSTEPVDTE